MTNSSEIPADVKTLFVKFAWQLKDRGFAHHSSDAILHRIRWHEHVEMGNRNFKVNNNWSSVLARWLMETTPQFRGFFETREKRHANAEAVE